MSLVSRQRVGSRRAGAFAAAYLLPGAEAALRLELQRLADAARRVARKARG
jgi:hypothetical protein